MSKPAASCQIRGQHGEGATHRNENGCDKHQEYSCIASHSIDLPKLLVLVFVLVLRLWCQVVSYTEPVCSLESNVTKSVRIIFLRAGPMRALYDAAE
jgi:hypothetical protein